MGLHLLLGYHLTFGLSKRSDLNHLIVQQRSCRQDKAVVELLKRDISRFLCSPQWRSNLCGMTSRGSSTGLGERDKLAATEVEDSSLRLCARRTVHVGGAPSHPGALGGVQVPLLLLQVSWPGKGLLVLPKYSPEAEAGRPLPTSPSVPHSACTESSSYLCHQ